jgi:hypothetical protein
VALFAIVGLFDLVMLVLVIGLILFHIKMRINKLTTYDFISAKRIV